MTDQILKITMSGIQKYLIPLMSEKYKQYKLKQLRQARNNVSVILLPRKSGKTYITNYINSLELQNNVICIDFDQSNMIKSNYEYENTFKLIGNNYDIMMLPSKLKILNEMKENFNKYSIVVITSDHNLAHYLTNEYEIINFMPSTMFYQDIYNSSNETDKLEIFKSYNNILKLNLKYKTYSSMEELREYVKMLFV